MKKFVHFFSLALLTFVCVQASDHSKTSGELQVGYEKSNPVDDQIIGYSTTIRPFRISGIRLEIEHFKNKTIVHNYGHGGSGLTLSWGCAQHVAQLVEQELAQTRQETKQIIAVIGAGVIGLSVVHELLEKGYSVNVYARKFPHHMGQNVGGGAIRTFGLSQGQDQELLKKLETVSRERFEKCAHDKQPEFCGVKEVVDFKNSSDEKVSEKSLLVVDVNQYMNDLFEKGQKKGAQFVLKVFTTKDEVAQLQESVVVNCTGYGAKDLFADQDVYPMRGHTDLLAH